jgi:hypothetical protein
VNIHCYQNPTPNSVLFSAKWMISHDPNFLSPDFARTSGKTVMTMLRSVAYIADVDP